MFLSRLIYYSHPEHIGTEELERISVVSQANNYLDGITGVLFYNGGWFVQVLEGSRTRVSQRYAKIAADVRHRDVTLIEFKAVTERMFSEWDMRYIGADPSHERIVRRFMPEGFDPTVIYEGDVITRLLRCLLDSEPREG